MEISSLKRTKKNGITRYQNQIIKKQRVLVKSPTTDPLTHRPTNHYLITHQPTETTYPSNH